MFKKGNFLICNNCYGMIPGDTTNLTHGKIYTVVDDEYQGYVSIVNDVNILAAYRAERFALSLKTERKLKLEIICSK